MPLALIRTFRSIFDFNESILLIGSEKSSGIPNLRGVPQGSSLSPIMFNFFINALIVKLEQELKVHQMPSNCLFFADDGNLHSPDPVKIQLLLNVCNKWALENGMLFAADKCFVVANQDYEFKLGSSILPQVDSAKYLGIEFKCKGPDWVGTALKLSLKAKKAAIALIRIGFNRTTWDASAKVRVYKLFIRSMLEYGMQIHLYDSISMDLMQKSQMMALRIASGVPWNCSKTALKRLCCLEDMKCRNRILNSRFVHRLLNLEDRNNIPACLLWSRQIMNAKSIANSWRISNPYYHRISLIQDPLLVSKEIKVIRYENISQDTLGHTNISDAIVVLPSLLHSDIMKWNGIEDAKVKQELIQWRLGRVAFHQRCQVCFEVLSRSHAVICSGAEDYLLEKFPQVTRSYSNTIIDDILNFYFLKCDEFVWKAVYEAIVSIRRSCLLQNVE